MSKWAEYLLVAFWLSIVLNLIYWSNYFNNLQGTN